MILIYIYGGLCWNGWVQECVFVVARMRVSDGAGMDKWLMIRGRVLWEELFSPAALNKSRRGVLWALHSVNRPFIPGKTSLAVRYSSSPVFFHENRRWRWGVGRICTEVTCRVMSPPWAASEGQMAVLVGSSPLFSSCSCTGMTFTSPCWKILALLKEM